METYHIMAYNDHGLLPWRSSNVRNLAGWAT